MNSPAPVYTDFSGLAKLKSQAAQNAEGSVGEVARQFESLLMQQMVKSMRQASLGEGILDNDQSLFYRDMFDQQLSLHLANSGGIGLAAAIERQLGGAQASLGSDEGRSLQAYQSRRTERAQALLSGEPRATGSVSPGTAAEEMRSPDDFVANLWPWAREAAARIGLQPEALLAQAALETGWGRKGIRRGDGAPSHNLFGIKADSRWQGDRASASTLEYQQGVAVRQRESFRSYASYRDSFNDYVDFLRANPRYEQALAATADSGEFFGALQQAGYATDPRYAEKIERVMQGREMQGALERLTAGGKVPL